MSNKRRKICVVTGSRADYGLLYWLLKEIQQDPALCLQLVVTGMHLKKQFGSTYKVIEKDGFPIDAKVDILKFNDTEEGVTKAIGLGCHGFAGVFKNLKPDIVVVLGDRFEMLSVAIASYIAKIPLAHIHGGETTEGLIDEGIRHSITKMSSLHFVSTSDYFKRVVQLGEDPRYVYHVGAPGLDHLYKTKFLNKKELSERLNFPLGKVVVLMTYHPVTLEKTSPQQQIETVLSVIDEFGFQVIFTKANADPYGSVINRVVEIFCRRNPDRYRLFDSVGQFLYYSCLKNCQLMIGNSSSGIIEAASFHLPVVNIGDRQKNRVKGINVIDVGYVKSDIKQAIRHGLSKKFIKAGVHCKNPYDRYRDGQTSRRIKETLRNVKFNKEFIKKSFYDLSFEIS